MKRAATGTEALPRIAGLSLLREIGHGGSGVVYAARLDGRDQLDSGPMAGEPVRELAVKLLREELALSPRERRRFVEEAERMGRVAHPGVICVIEAGTAEDGRPFIAMPLLHGETLAARLRRGRLPLDVALAHFEVMAGAVEALHQNGLVHRDIKPENVFIDERNERPVLLDFGIASELAGDRSTTTQAGRVRGTPAYMAPERFFGTPASITTDVYELAVVLYCMLVGELPWSDDASASARLHPRPPSEVGVPIPQPIVRVVLRALSTRPEARPAGARALLEELQRARSSDADMEPRSTVPNVGMAHRPQSAPEPPAPARRPTRKASLVLAGAAFALLTLGLSRSEPAPTALPAEMPRAVTSQEPNHASAPAVEAPLPSVAVDATLPSVEGSEAAGPLRPASSGANAPHRTVKSGAHSPAKTAPPSERVPVPSGESAPPSGTRALAAEEALAAEPQDAASGARLYQDRK